MIQNIVLQGNKSFSIDGLVMYEFTSAFIAHILLKPQELKRAPLTVAISSFIASYRPAPDQSTTPGTTRPTVIEQWCVRFDIRTYKRKRSQWLNVPAEIKEKLF